jgi:predicted  nucleic acid-binding Zn-ribbon protein
VIHDLKARLANNNVDFNSELQEYITFLEEAAEEASWTESSQRDENRLLEVIVDSKNISSMEKSIDWERSRNYMLCEENCQLSGEVGRLQAQINNLQASHTGMESKMEYPPSMESTSCAACVGETAGVMDNCSSDDNLSLFSSSDDDGSN